MYINKNHLWLIWLVAFVSVTNLNLYSVRGAGTLPVPGAGGCVNGTVYVANALNPCPREYLRCDEGLWRRSMCAGGIINDRNGQCVPSTTLCPNSGLTARSYTGRFKRQAPSLENCTRSYQCPQSLTEIFIYPDWANPACDSYVVCAGGQLLLASCTRDNYSYYNPTRLSCEEFPSTTNLCVNRLETDLGPAFPQDS